MLCATEKWAVWQTEQLVEATIGFRAPSYDYRFYLQRLTDAEASLVATLRGTKTGMIGTVTGDGTFVLKRGTEIHWNTLGKAPVMEVPGLSLWAVYPDGVVFHDWAIPEPRPIEFAPFNLYIFDLESKTKQITPLAASLHQSYCATAFDGDLVTSYHIAFDAKTGELTSTTRLPGRIRACFEWSGHSRPR